MPSYEYRCQVCGKKFEFFLTRAICAEDKICPECGSKNVVPVYRDMLGFSQSCVSTTCDWDPNSFN